jgi:NADPH:quinone reductase-like Zn-dependent oxidoreductase
MKAMLCTAYGPPEVLRLGELDKSTPRSNQVLIRIRAAAVTISDCIVRSGKVKPLLWLPMRIFVGFGRPRNPVLGLDLAGEVEAVGAAVQRFKAGDAVIAFTGKHFGAYAEYACLPADGVRGPQDALIAPKPANLSYAEAAVLPSRGGLAWHFVGHGQVQAGQRVLVFGASGAIGTFAVQMAKHIGAQVTGVCSTANVELVKSLGAEDVIDYTREDFTQRPERYDLIFDAVGKRYSNKIACHKALAPNGKLISVDDGTPQLGIDTLTRLTELVEARHLRPVIDRVYPLEQTADAHRYVEQGHKKGNVVITVEHDSKT